MNKLTTFFSINVLNNINIIINIVVGFIIIYSLIRLYKEYYSYQEFDMNNITKPDDINIINEKYSDSKLQQWYLNLSDTDKEYFEHLINYARIKYKDNKPSFQKKIKTFRSNVFINVLITLILKQKVTAAVDTLKHNILLTSIS